MKKHIKYKQKICIVILVIGMVLDIFNIPSKIKIPIANFNLEFWNICVVIILYVITYEIIDKRNYNRKVNQEKIANVLLNNTYALCKENVELIDSQMFKDIVPKRFPGNETVENNSAYEKMKVVPFECEETIFKFAEEGIISAEKIESYLSIRSNYRTYFTNIVVFPDRDDITDIIKSDLLNELEKAKNSL